MTQFSFGTTFGPQFRDLDPFEHVNQALYLILPDVPISNGECRIAPHRSGECLCADRCSRDYSGSISYLEQARTKYWEEVVLIVFDPDTHPPTPIPPEWREPIEAHGGVDE